MASDNLDSCGLLRVLMFILRAWDAVDIFEDKGKKMSICVLKKKNHHSINNMSEGAKCGYRRPIARPLQ